MDAANLANIISACALLLSIYSAFSVHRSGKSAETRELAQLKRARIAELEQKLDTILASKDNLEFIRHKVETYQQDLGFFCKEYELDSEQVFRAFSSIYLPITNDGEDFISSLPELMSAGTELIKILKS